MNTQTQNLPFAGLTIRLNSTGKQAPKMEYQASSNKSQFQCSLTKRLYKLDQINEWLSSPELQKYHQSGYVGKWGAKIQNGEPNQWNDGKQLSIVFYMVKPFNKGGYNQSKPMMQSTSQSQQGYQLQDDPLPESPREEIDWAKESSTDFNPEQYEQELG